YRFACNQNGGGKFAALDLFEGFRLRHADFLDLDAERLEDVAHRITCSAALCIDVDRKTSQLLDRGNIGSRNEMDLLGKQLGEIDDLVVGLPHPLIRTTKII